MDWREDSLITDAAKGERACRLLVVTGETSGEQHAARLLDALVETHPQLRLELQGAGGRLLEERGVKLIADIRDLAAIGPLAAFSNLRSYLRLFRQLTALGRNWRPDVAVLVDFAEFNLRLARRLSRLGIPVYYFISPQIWAWREGRAAWVKRYVDKMVVILPFEVDFYRQHGVEAHFAGHPLVWQREFRRGDQPPADQPRIALLPGSRRSEVDSMLGLLLESARLIREEIPARFRLLVGPDLDRSAVEAKVETFQHTSGSPLDLEVNQGAIEQLLPDCDYAIIKSGTSTLQATILEVPFAMVYRMSSLSYWMLRPLVRTRTYCLANWIAGEPVVEEFVQNEARPEKIARHAIDSLNDPKKWAALKQNLKNASELLVTENNDAYRRAAGYLIDLIEDGRKS